MSTEDKSSQNKKMPFSKTLAVSVALVTGGILASGFAVTSVLDGDSLSIMGDTTWLAEGEVYRAATQQETDMLHERLSKHMGAEVKLLSAARTSIPELYLLLLPSDSFYYHSGEEKFIRGDIYNALNKANETESLNKILAGIANLNGHAVHSLPSTNATSNAVAQMNADEQFNSALSDTLKQMKATNAAANVREIGSIPDLGTQEPIAPKTPSISKQELESQINSYGGDKMSNEMAKFNLDGRVDPSKVETYRTTVKYMGSTFPRVGFDKQGKELAPEVKARQVKALVDFVERAGDRWSVVYRAKEEKASMVVFTDPTCPFCKKFHHEIEDYNNAGITVYYLFYPRHIGMGMGDKNFKKAMSMMDSIWYSENRNQAADDVFDGYRVSGKEVIGDIKNPAFEHYLLGQIMGTEGTPRILMSNGDEMTGYLDWKHISKKVLK